jgi:hypothetical protein
VWAAFQVSSIHAIRQDGSDDEKMICWGSALHVKFTRVSSREDCLSLLSSPYLHWNSYVKSLFAYLPYDDQLLLWISSLTIIKVEGLLVETKLCCSSSFYLSVGCSIWHGLQCCMKKWTQGKTSRYR